MPWVDAAIDERWAIGHDPDGLVPTAQGCHLERFSAHAQFGRARGSRGAFRRDLDRSKRRKLRIHDHPLGQLNEVRVGRDHLGTPLEWVIDVELLFAGRFS